MVERLRIMHAEAQYERETRAPRNEALFRSVNDKMATLNQAFATVTKTFAIACECADATCLTMLEISPDAYRRVRENPRHFAVLRGHVYPDVETVVNETDGYVVVEKAALAGEVATELAAQE
jgi:5-bromo-4-chloroindolyl phosphate hydrolysis protein